MKTNKVIELDKKSTVCLLSSDIQFLIRNLKKELEPEQKEVLALISGKVRLVQKKAQKMENRLKKYRNAVESLGFKRKSS